MWENPIYQFNEEAGTDKDGTLLYKQVVIDVTRSAPSFATPGKALAAALDTAVSETGIGKKDTILDFGAGKLRNTIYLLERGYKVCAVEYAQQFERSEPARHNLDLATDKYKHRFSSLVYPDSFAASGLKFKLILLINVVNIMPVPAEREYVLALCNKKLARDGRLLWYTQRGDQNYQKRLQNRYRLGDGVYVGRHAYQKTFYREYSVREINALLRRAGFDYDQKIPATWRNQSRLYARTSAPVQSPEQLRAAIDKARVSDESIPIPKATRRPSRDHKKRRPREPKKKEPRKIVSSTKRHRGNANAPTASVEAGLIRLLKAQQRDDEQGNGQIRSYADLMRQLLEELFGNALHRFETVHLPDNSAFQDLLAWNRSKGGFFASLGKRHNLTSRRIVVRCRNRKSVNKTDPAFGDLSEGMDHNLMFGLLTYRGGLRRPVMERCQTTFRKEETAILPLDDGDLTDLLTMKMNGSGEGSAEAIDGFLSRRLSKVMQPIHVFVSYSRRDQRMMGEVRTALKPLEKRGAIDLYIDTSKNRAGDDWLEKVKNEVDRADVAVFLISPNSVASDVIPTLEVNPLLDAKKERGLRVIPVLLLDVVLPRRLADQNLQFIHQGKPVAADNPAKRAKAWKELVEEVSRSF